MQPDNVPTQFLPEISDDNPGESQKFHWAAWESPLQISPLEHHIVTEEEVYQYYLINQKTSEAHLTEGKVAFALIALEQTTFLSDMNTFWSLWVSPQKEHLSHEPRMMSLLPSDHRTEEFFSYRASRGWFFVIFFSLWTT